MKVLLLSDSTALFFANASEHNKVPREQRREHETKSDRLKGKRWKGEKKAIENTCEKVVNKSESKAKKKQKNLLIWSRAGKI